MARKKDILIVEDQVELLKLETLLLTSRGYTVRGAVDGRMALDCLQSHKPDLVVLDIMLPELNGYEVCQQIKGDAATRNIPVVMVTAKNSREDMAKAEEVGADCYITKPFKSADFIATIQGFLSGATASLPSTA